MIRLIACDLDETLLDEHKQVAKGNLKEIQRARDAGILFVPASGRGYTSMDAILKELNLYQKPGEYTISNNGGIVIENHTLQHISFHSFPYEQAVSLFTFGYQRQLCVEVFTNHDVYAFHLNEDERTWLYQFKKDAITCKEKNIEFLKQEPIVKILFQHTDMNVLHELAKEMQSLTQEIASVSFSSNRYLELNPIGVDKGVGLQELARYLHIPMEETMAIGDNDNDRELLRVAGLSIAVANASEDIKALADHVTVHDHKNGAVGEAIRRFVFQESIREGR